MKKNIMKKIIFPSMLLFFLVVACKKKTSTPVNTAVSSLINTYNYNNKDLTTFYRDANGRLVKTVSNDTTSSIIEYVSSTTVISKDYKNDSLVSTVKYTLNEKGYAIFLEYTYNNKTIIDTNYYDPNGFWLDFKNQQITIENGNVIKRIGQNNDTTIYEFDLTKLNSINSFSFIGSNLEGQDDKNLVISEKTGINSADITKYTYEFDAKNRVINKTRSTYSNGTKQGTDDVETFTYTD